MLTLVPQTTWAKTSWPMSSVPNQWAAEGGWEVSAPYPSGNGAISGAQIATRASRISRIPLATPRGLRRKEDQVRWRGVSSTAAAVMRYAPWGRGFRKPRR